MAKESAMKQTGCPVPWVVCVKRQVTVPIDQSNGTQMFCSNPSCEISGSFVHNQCFENLELALKKLLKVKGRGRRWTDDQIQENLWTKKTMTLMKSQLICPSCDKGIMDIRSDFRLTDKKNGCVNGSEVKSSIYGRKKRGKDLPQLVVKPVQLNSGQRKQLRVLQSHFLSIHSDDELEIAPTQSSSRCHSVSSSSDQAQCINQPSTCLDDDKLWKVPEWWFEDEVNESPLVQELRDALKGIRC
ncbi:hypothetical protein M3Y94_00156000 [Aphelenchoides besseyi]|nr:hypothetical protein M3Y94_00156000 [Aphelenchoides besseyi]KAI6237119.1 hypothetical protein M3Y95_00231500 [Aphelenchoides besseyi]